MRREVGDICTGSSRRTAIFLHTRKCDGTHDGTSEEANTDEEDGDGARADVDEAMIDNLIKEQAQRETELKEDQNSGLPSLRARESE
jgi:hypothetical protein